MSESSSMSFMGFNHGVIDYVSRHRSIPPSHIHKVPKVYLSEYFAFVEASGVLLSQRGWDTLWELRNIPLPKILSHFRLSELLAAIVYGKQWYGIFLRTEILRQLGGDVFALHKYIQKSVEVQIDSSLMEVLPSYLQLCESRLITRYLMSKVSCIREAARLEVQ